MKRRLSGLLVVAVLTSACVGAPAVGTRQPTVEVAPPTPAYVTAVSGSTPQSTVEVAAPSPEPPAADAELRTLQSLRRLDDFPLYEMHYYGDYGFDGFLEEGLEVDTQAALHLHGVLDAWACTCFAALSDEGDMIFGRNFDWHLHPALFLFTDPPDAYASASMVDISYLGYGKEEPSGAERRALLDAPYLPFDGLNECGLAVGIMAVPYADGGDDPAKVTIGSLHAVRLMLDYASDVDEAIRLLRSYNIDFEDGPPVHYLVADSSGKSAVLEFLDGELSVVRNTQSWQVATNFLISGTTPAERGSLCPRYRMAHQTLEQAAGSISPTEAMALLEDVSQSGDFPTIWSVVYNLTAGDIEVVVGREYRQTYQFGLETRHQ